MENGIIKDLRCIKEGRAKVNPEHIIFSSPEIVQALENIASEIRRSNEINEKTFGNAWAKVKIMEENKPKTKEQIEWDNRIYKLTHSYIKRSIDFYVRCELPFGTSNLGRLVDEIKTHFICDDYIDCLIGRTKAFRYYRELIRHHTSVIHRTSKIYFGLLDEDERANAILEYRHHKPEQDTTENRKALEEISKAILREMLLDRGIDVIGLVTAYDTRDFAGC